MTIDGRIPMLGQPMQLNSPLNMLARVQGIDNMRQTNALNAMQMQDAQAQRAAKAQQEQARQQALANFPDPPEDAPEHVKQAVRGFKAGLLPFEKVLEAMKPDEYLSAAPGSAVINRRTGQSTMTVPQQAPKVDVNKPFTQGPDGAIIPNLPYQAYERSLKEKPARVGSAGSAAQAVPSTPDGGGEDQAALTRRFGKAGAGYRWKEDGSQEAIPGGPADQKAQAKAAGEGTVDNVAAGLRVHYDNLDKSGGITNPEKGALENLPAAISSSGVGQVAGRMFGTQNQSARNSIAMTRPMLMQAIMKATGMSSKQMDSNAELKLWIATATDPTLDVRANREALDRIESLYGSDASGAKQSSGAAPGGWSIRKAQ